MDNNSYRSQYLLSLGERENLQEKSIRVLSTFWDRVSQAEQELGRSLEDGYSREEYLSLIERLNTSNTNVFLVTKCRIGKYVKWLQQQEAISEECVDALYSVEYEDVNASLVFETRYFRDFSSLQDTIDTTLWAAEKVDDAVFAMQISLIYMAWCGVTMEKALEVKKEDVGEDQVFADGRTIRPNSQIMKYLQDYRDADGYSSQGRAVVNFKYVPSEYLFRSARADRIDTRRAIIALHRFGQSGGEKKNPFLYEKIYWSGIFNRAYIYELEHGKIRKGDVSTMQALFQEEYANSWKANHRLKEYQSFRNYFYPAPQK